MDNYESSLKNYRDLKGVMDTARIEAREEGLEEGIKAGKLEMARNLKIAGVPIETIIAASQLSREEIENL